MNSYFTLYAAPGADPESITGGGKGGGGGVRKGQNVFLKEIDSKCFTKLN